MMMNQFPKEKLQCVLNEVWESPLSDFYRNVWKKNGIVTRPILSDQHSWEKIPFLSRAILEEWPHPSDRLYISIEDAGALRPTSGTSKRKPLYLWRNRMTKLLSWDYNAGARRVMTFFSQNLWDIFDAQGAGLEMLYGNSRNLSYSAELLVQAGVNAIVAPSTLLLVLADYLEERHYLDNIRLLIFSGESCPDATLTVLKKKFPHAKFHIRYSLAEVNDSVMYASDDCVNGSHIMHARSNFFFIEIIKKELVLTSLRLPYTLPLIRYRTGDAARPISDPCPCGSEDLRYELIGRINGDFVRIGGGELRIEELERVITPFYAYIEPLFKVEVSERHAEGRRTVHLAFLIKKRAGCELPEDLIQHNITTSLLRDLHLSPTMRLGDAVAAQLFLQPQVVFVESLPVDLKNPRIVMQKKELPN